VSALGLLAAQLTEVMDTADLEKVAAVADVQVGARNMHNFSSSRRWGSG